MAPKTSKFTDAPIAFVPREPEEGPAIGTVCRKAGISGATFRAWRKKCGDRSGSSRITARWVAGYARENSTLPTE